MKVCPNCGSKNIYAIDGGVLGDKYRCEDCGYEGMLVVEIEKEEYDAWLKELKKEK
ncbi:MAG: hypothetical protein GXO25_02975 [Euryarchaeota archaeon]|nr:hypothetical protein [Euryarchaeota archaeon]